MRFGLLLIGLILGAVLWGAFWFELADRAEDGIETKFESIAKRGVATGYRNLQIEGFPYRIEMLMDDLRLADESGNPAMSLDIEKSVILTHPWTPGHYVLKAEQVSLKFSRMVVRAPVVRASLVDDDQGRRIDIDFGPVSIDFPATGGIALRAARLQLHLLLPDRENRDPDADGLYGPERADLALQFSRLTLGPFTSSAPSPEIGSLELRAELHGAIPLPLSADSFALWRDNGGLIELRSLKAQWDRYLIEGDGSLSLDEILRPLGALTVRTNGGAALLGWLEDRDLIRRDSEAAARALVAAMTADAGDGPIEAPLAIQEGEILIGALPLSAVTPLLKGPKS